MSKERILGIPSVVDKVIVKVGALSPERVIPFLSPAETRAMEAQEQAEREAVKRQFGDQTGAGGRDDTWDDGVCLIKGESIFTMGALNSIESLGYRFVDAFMTKRSDDRPLTWGVFSRSEEPTVRATKDARRHLGATVNKAWSKAFVWVNLRRPIPNVTLNLFGSAKFGPKLVVKAETANDPAAV